MSKWAVLDLDADPTPGDPVRTKGLADYLGEQAELAGGNTGRLRRLADQAAEPRGEAEIRCVDGITNALERAGITNELLLEKARGTVSAPLRSWDASVQLAKEAALWPGGLVAMILSGRSAGRPVGEELGRGAAPSEGRPPRGLGDVIPDDASRPHPV